MRRRSRDASAVYRQNAVSYTDWVNYPDGDGTTATYTYGYYGYSSAQSQVTQPTSKTSASVRSGSFGSDTGDIVVRAGGQSQGYSSANGNAYTKGATPTNQRCGATHTLGTFLVTVGVAPYLGKIQFEDFVNGCRVRQRSRSAAGKSLTGC